LTKKQEEQLEQISPIQSDLVKDRDKIVKTNKLIAIKESRNEEFDRQLKLITEIKGFNFEEIKMIIEANS